MKGTNSGGGGSYSGTVTVVATGDTYRVRREIGDDSFAGTGIGNDKFLAVTYSGGDGQTGLALYAPNARGVLGGGHLDLCRRQEDRHRELAGEIAP